MTIRSDWTLKELQELYDSPLFALVSKAHLVHTQFHTPGEIQMCSLISVKTGGCTEDCKYCSQSSRYKTFVSPQPLMQYGDVIKAAKKAIDRGASRICMGAAWRGIRDNNQFEEVLRMIKGVAALGAEVCCSLGLLNDHQAKRLKEAGLYAYNHNLDSSERFYKTIITTRTYQDRLDTLDAIAKAGISVCCGGIVGMGEEPIDRLELLLNLCTRNPHPDSMPINRFFYTHGTPLKDIPKMPIWDLIRLVAIARITMPKLMVRLSVGRIELSIEQQALCFFAGANSIHGGEKLLTLPNNHKDQDEELFNVLGLQKMAAYANTP